MSSNTTDAPLYAVAFYSGLRKVMLAELEDTVTEVKVVRTLIGRRYDFLIFRFGGPPTALAPLRTAENLFVLATDFEGIAVHRQRGPARLSEIFQQANMAALIDQVACFRDVKIAKPANFTTTLQVQGNHKFEESDVQAALSTALTASPALANREDGSALNVRVQLIRDKGFIGIQLNHGAMKARTYKQQTRAGSLDPTVAHALVALTTPEPGEVLLDAMCGAGTVAIEAALAYDWKTVICGDLDEEAVAMTAKNAAAADVALDVQSWDALALPLANASVDRAATNLPYGKDIPLEKPAPFIRDFLQELARVLRPGGRAALLCAHPKLMIKLVQHSRALTRIGTFDIELYGIDVNIVVLKRR